ncbi:MAG: hypothetical protein ACI4VL_01390 [Bacilli bacterium]
MIDDKEILFSSFLAGFLLVKGDISYLEISNEISRFQYSNDLIIVDPGFDFHKLKKLIVVDDFGIRLILDYDKEYIDNGSLILVKDYLYNLTTEEIRRHFNIEEKEIINIYTSEKREKKYSKLIKFKKTKVYI